MQLSPDKALRVMPFLILVFLAFNVTIMIVHSYGDVNRIIRFQAQPSDNFAQVNKTRNKIALGENSFITGYEGDVLWKAKTFKEAFILNSIVESSGPLSALDAIWFFIFDCILFWIVYDIKAENLFSKKVLKGGVLLWFFFILLSCKEMIHEVVSDYFLNHITHGQFETVFEIHSQMPFLPFLFPIVLLFIQKAQKAEEDQNLTV